MNLDTFDKIGGGMSKECVTHHHACDCREAKFAELEKANALLLNVAKVAKEILMADINSPRPFHYGEDGCPDNDPCDICRSFMNLSSALSAAKDVMGEK